MSAVTFSYVLVALMLAVLLCNFWRLRPYLRFSARFDVAIENSLFRRLPIYTYFSHYVNLVISAGTILMITSVVLAILSTKYHFEASSSLEIIATLLTVILGIHMAFIACFESINIDKIIEEKVLGGLRKFRKKVWINALWLFGFLVFLMAWRYAIPAISI